MEAVILLKQPNQWSCSVTALAMATGLDLDYIIKAIGHDGSKIISLDPEPLCREGFGIFELTRVAVDEGFSVTTLPFYFKKHHKIIHQEDWVWSIMRRSQGIITCDLPHVVAWDGSKVFDPNGTIYDFPIKPIAYYLIKSSI